MCTCIHVHKHSCVHAFMYTCIHVYIHSCIHEPQNIGPCVALLYGPVCMYVCIALLCSITPGSLCPHVWGTLYVHTNQVYACMCVHVCGSVYAYISIHLYVCMYVCTINFCLCIFTSAYMIYAFVYLCI